MGQHQLCDANANHTAHRGTGHEGRGEEQDQKRVQLPQFSPDRRCGAAVQDPVTAGANLPQPLRQGLHRQRLRIHMGGRAPLLPRLCESHLPQAAEEVRPAPHPLSRPAPHLRQHAAVGGLRPERRPRVVRPLGHQDDREHLRPSGHTPQAFHRQRLGAGVAAIEAVKKKAPNPFGFDAPADPDSHPWSEWRESNSRPLEPHTSELSNSTLHPVKIGYFYFNCYNQLKTIIRGYCSPPCGISWYDSDSIDMASILLPRNAISILIIIRDKSMAHTHLLMMTS